MIKKRINNLRKWMTKENIQAQIIPTNDPHFSEYVAPHWETREWISNFKGSAGTVIVTDKKALLWCDSRYFIQAEKELDNEIFILMKIGQEGVPTINEWLKENMPKNTNIAIDGKLISVAAYNEMVKQLPDNKIVSSTDPFTQIWDERPSIPTEKARILPITATGESITSKRERVARELGLEKGIYITAMLDEIAWLLNTRGADVEYNPVTISYAVIAKSGISLFVDKTKFSKTDIIDLNSQGVTLHEYNDFDKFLSTLSGIEVTINASKFDIYHYNLLLTSGAEVKEEEITHGTITKLKSIKNDTEIEGTRKAMIEDGVALVRFNIWLEEMMTTKSEVSEYDLANKLRDLRLSMPSCVGESFGSIVGYGSNGAIVHYSPSEEESATIHPDNFVLIDTGGQYNFGTTDITRTIHLSMPTEEQKHDYTLILRGNIALSMAHFPVGTTGNQLDILARQFLMREGLNYGHGTGHGVGHQLNVHEGPQSIRMEYNPVQLEVGMITSNEPGLYKRGEYGIRLENLVLCCKSIKNEYGNFMKFETLTLYPFDKKSIDYTMLSKDEKQWLDNYHATVYEKLSPSLTSEECKWLKSHL